MAEIRIPLADEQMAQLREVAERYGIAPEEIARLSLEDLLSRSDESIQAQIDYVMEKNKELYQRLAG
ncbi:MAG: DNA-binding protein [Chloroflexi bacterium]|nr:DNA-binding protein [Chloroflexota bacterium]